MIILKRQELGSPMLETLWSVSIFLGIALVAGYIATSWVVLLGVSLGVFQQRES